MSYENSLSIISHTYKDSIIGLLLLIMQTKIRKMIHKKSVSETESRITIELFMIEKIYKKKQIGERGGGGHRKFVLNNLKCV